jgi:hypothetical protein
MFGPSALAFVILFVLPLGLLLWGVLGNGVRVRIANLVVACICNFVLSAVLWFNIFASDSVGVLGALSSIVFPALFLLAVVWLSSGWYATMTRRGSIMLLLLVWGPYLLLSGAVTLLFAYTIFVASGIPF